MVKVKAKRAKLHKYKKDSIWKGEPGRHPTSEIDFHMHPVTKRYYPMAYLDMEGNLDDNREWAIDAAKSVFKVNKEAFDCFGIWQLDQFDEEPGAPPFGEPTRKQHIEMVVQFKAMTGEMISFTTPNFIEFKIVNHKSKDREDIYKKGESEQVFAALRETDEGIHEMQCREQMLSDVEYQIWPFIAWVSSPEALRSMEEWDAIHNQWQDEGKTIRTWLAMNDNLEIDFEQR